MKSLILSVVPFCARVGVRNLEKNFKKLESILTMSRNAFTSGSNIYIRAFCDSS